LRRSLKATQAYIDAAKTISGVDYIYIQDAQGSILAHTFTRFPPYFEEHNWVRADELGHGRRVKISGNIDIELEGHVLQVIDVPAGVSGGLGVVHVGMDCTAIDRDTSAFHRRMLVTAAAICLILILMSLGAAWLLLLAPLSRVDAAAKCLHRGDFGECHA